MSTVFTEQSLYADQFSTLRERLPGSHLPWVQELRQDAMEKFLALGFPTTKLEDWKYTNVAPIRRTTFKAATGLPAASVPELNIHESPRLVFANGRFVPTFSTVDVRLNVHLMTLSEALQDRQRASVIKTH